MRCVFFKPSKHSTYNLWIIIILFVGVLIRLYKFGILMDPIMADEIGSSYDAWSLLNYGTDRYGYSYPLYFQNFESGQSSMLIYMIMVSIKIFGFNRFAIRLPALVNSIVLAVFGTLIAGEIEPELQWIDTDFKSKKRLQLIFGVLYVTSPYTFMASKIALDCNLMYGMSTLFLYATIKAFKSEKWIWYLTAGICAGLTLYTYAISYMTMPIMLILSFIYICYQNRARVNNIICFTIPVMLLATPLIIEQLINMDLLNYQLIMIGPFSIYKMRVYRVGEVGLNNFFINIVNGLKSALYTDNIQYNSDPRFFTFYPMSIPFFFIGLMLLVKDTINSIKNKSPKCESFVFFWILGMVVSTGLMTSPNTNRVNGAMFSVMLCISFGVLFVIKSIDNKYSSMARMAITSSYIIYFLVFLFVYFQEIAYADCTTASMCPEAIEYINSKDNLREKVVVTNIPPYLYMGTILPPPSKIDEYGNYKDELYVCYAYWRNDPIRDYVYNEGGTDSIYLIYRPLDDDIDLFSEMGAVEKQFGYSFHLYYWE